MQSWAALWLDDLMPCGLLEWADLPLRVLGYILCWLRTAHCMPCCAVNRYFMEWVACVGRLK